MNEIKWTINLGRGGNDDLSMGGESSSTLLDLGTDGINPNASGGVVVELSPDADIVLRGVDATHVTTLQGADEVDAAGNAAVGGDLPAPARGSTPATAPTRSPAALSGGATGLGGDDDIDGHNGDDVLQGGANDDVIGVAALRFPERRRRSHPRWQRRRP